MADVPGKLGNIAEVAALGGSLLLCYLGQGKGERLVVYVESELPALQHVPKVQDARHAGKEVSTMSATPCVSYGMPATLLC